MRSFLLWLAMLAVAPCCVASAPVLDYSLKFGGSRQHGVAGAVMDSDRSVYVAGWTNSPDFPTTRQTPSAVSQGSQDIFVTRLAPDGASMMCSVVIGGKFDEYANAIALGPAGSVYVLGSTPSPDFPMTAGSPATDRTLFLMRVDPCEGRIFFSTLFPRYGSTGGLAVDSAKNAIVAAQSGPTPIDPQQLRYCPQT